MTEIVQNVFLCRFLGCTLKELDDMDWEIVEYAKIIAFKRFKENPFLT